MRQAGPFLHTSIGTYTRHAHWRFKSKSPRQSTPIHDVRSTTLWRVEKCLQCIHANAPVLRAPLIAIPHLKQIGRQWLFTREESEKIGRDLLLVASDIRTLALKRLSGVTLHTRCCRDFSHGVHICKNVNDQQHSVSKDGNRPANTQPRACDNIDKYFPKRAGRCPFLHAIR